MAVREGIGADSQRNILNEVIVPSLSRSMNSPPRSTSVIKPSYHLSAFLITSA
jgi:hypothetical protein